MTNTSQTATTASVPASDAVRHALELAHGMLATIEQGGSYSYHDWDDAMARIERAMGIDSLRARHIATEG